MNRQELEDFLKGASDSFRVLTEEAWACEVQDVPVHAYLNVAKDRMRLMATVSLVDDVPPERALHLLRTGFHSDARYGIYGDTLYAVFVHSLSSLCDSDLRLGLRQVTELAQSFGTDYSRGLLRFQWPRPNPEESQRGGVRRRTEDAVRKSVESLRRRRERAE